MQELSQYLKPEVVWLVIGIVMFVVEFSAPGLVFMFFGMGAWAVAAVCLFADISLAVQVVIFMAVSLVCLVFLRKRFRKTFTGDSRDTGQDMVSHVGRKVLVKEKIVPRYPGKVEMGGTLWSADSDSTIEQGTMVEVTGRDGRVLKVKPLERSES
jgi:membrane protein implicated in regulation of membrane protease activity